MNIREATEYELQALSELCLRSKGYWGYGTDFLDACRRELTLTPDELDETSIAVADRDGRPVGLVQVKVEEDVCDLLKLFVEPSEMGNGHGTVLFEWAVSEARRLGAELMTIEADPDAVPFYRSKGARIVGTAPSGSLRGRELPLLELPLAGAQPRR